MARAADVQFRDRPSRYPVGVENSVRPVQAAIWCSWMRPPRRSVLRSLARSESVLCSGVESSADGAAWLRERGAVDVVVLDLLGEDGFEVAAAEDEHPVEALAPAGADHALADGVRPGRPDGAL